MIFTSTTRFLRPALPALLLLLGLATSASAEGLTGEFDPSKWKLLRTVNGQPYAPPPGNTPEGPLGDPAYRCDGNDLSCIDIINENNFTIVGSQAGDIGTSGEEVAINWQLVYEGPAPAVLSFDWNMVAEDDESQDKGYFAINGVEYLNPSSSGSAVGYTSPVINPGDTVTFGVFTADNAGELGEFSISNFNYTLQQQVPAPLPLLGAGATFAWSRRLKSRLQSSRPPEP